MFCDCNFRHVVGVGCQIWHFSERQILSKKAQKKKQLKKANLTTNTNYMSEIAITKHISDIFESVAIGRVQFSFL